jgi:uncharacterized protein YfaT (DUF1175 family)
MGYRCTSQNSWEKPIYIVPMKQKIRKKNTVFFKILIPVIIFSFSNKIGAYSVKAYLSEIALRQANHPDTAWSFEQRDCAGFIRYVFAQTFKSNRALWTDKTGKKTYYLRAEDLISNNFVPVLDKYSDNFSYHKLDTADVIVYYNPSKPPPDAWHLMLVLFPQDRKENEPIIVYHNGASDHKASVRKIWWRQLFEPQWNQWRPHWENPYFRGFYRWRGFATKTH